MAAAQRFSFWRKSQGTLKAGWSISGGKGCHLLQKEVFRQKEKRCCSRLLQPMDGTPRAETTVEENPRVHTSPAHPSLIGSGPRAPGCRSRVQAHTAWLAAGCSWVNTLGD
jgi:hypothetical protein